MQKIELLAITLCVFTLGCFAVYTIDLLNLPGSDDLIQQADAVRSTHQCYHPTLPWFHC